MVKSILIMIADTNNGKMQLVQMYRLATGAADQDSQILYIAVHGDNSCSDENNNFNGHD